MALSLFVRRVGTGVWLPAVARGRAVARSDGGRARGPLGHYVRRVLGAIGATAIVLMGFTCGSALASKALVNTIGSNAFGLTGTTGGLFNQPSGVAVNRTGNGGVPAGTVYVVDEVNSRIQEFSPTAGFVRTWGWGVRDGTAEFQTCTVADDCLAGLSGSGAGQLGDPQGIAVDQSTGALYLTDGGNGTVEVFSANGVFEGAFGWGVRDGSPSLQFCTAVSGCNSAAGFGGDAGQFSDLIGFPAVDPVTGDVYVADEDNNRVDVFTPTITDAAVTGISFVKAFGWGVSTGSDVFEVCSSVCQSGLPGNGVGQFGFRSPSELDVDSAGNVYVLDNRNKRVEKFDSTLSPVDPKFGGAGLSSVFGSGALENLAVDSNDHLFVSGLRPASSNRVAVVELDPSGALVDTHGLDLTVTAATGLAVAPASLGGNVYLDTFRSFAAPSLLEILNDPPVVQAAANITGTTATFSGKVVSDGFDVTYHFEASRDGVNWDSFPAADIDAGSAAGTVPVSEDVDGLTGSQHYLLRLVQNRDAGGGQAVSAQVSFTTPAAAPAITDTAASQPTDTAATLNAKLDAQNEATSYHFEYTDQRDFEANGFANATSTSTIDAGSGGGPTPISADITGLQPSTTYEFRVVATNATGTTQGPAQTVMTFQASPPRLPDGRVYELVSPADANGLFLGSIPEQDNNFPTPLASPDGNSVIFDTTGVLPGFAGNGQSDLYRSVRTPHGWSISSLSPDGTQARRAAVGGVSADHEYASWEVGSGGGSLDVGSGGPSRYLRYPNGRFVLVGQGSLGTDPDAQLWWPSAGLTHVIFSSSSPQLEPSAPPSGTQAIYDRTPDGTTHVVSLLPGDATPAAGDDASFQGASTDGSTVVFAIATTPGCPVEALGCPRTLYVRRNDANTYAVDTSPTAQFAGLSGDGKRLFYFDQTAFPSGNLFVFDVDSQTKTEIAGDDSALPVNISADGSHVYFVSTEQLDGSHGVAGANNLYVWDGTATRFVAVLDGADVDPFQPSLGEWLTAVGPTQNSVVGVADDPSRTAPDGTRLVFESRARLTGYDNGGHTEIYRYDTHSGAVDCVSCSPTGAPATSDASLQDITDLNAPAAPMNVIPNVSDDGQRVFFETGDRLAARDTNNQTDVYEWEADGTGSCTSAASGGGCLFLISSGRSGSPSHLIGASADGHDVFFKTQEALVPGDENGGSGSIYDARIDGGFASGTNQAPCAGDACQGALTTPPPPTTVASVMFGPGNPTPGSARRASVRILKRTVHGSRFSVKVKVSEKGLVTITGAAIRTARRSVTRPGTYKLSLRLTPKAQRALHHKRKLRVSVRVRYVPESGPASVAVGSLTVIAPNPSRHRTRAASHDRGGAR